jgi:PAS domain S-box-containing protein
MVESMSVVYVAGAVRDRAAAERTLPRHAPLAVATVSDATGARALLEDRDAECVVAEQSRGTDALDVLAAIRQRDPAVPLVVFEREPAASVAADAIDYDVSAYVRASDERDPLAALARATREAAASYRAEQEVAMVNELARNVYERITDGFFALDRDWEFAYMNAAAEEILEVDREDVMGENIWEAFPAATNYDFYPEYQRAMATQQPVTFREHFPPLDKTFEVRVFPSENGLSVHFRTVVEGEASEAGNHLLELTNVLSADLADSIATLRDNLDAVDAACDCEDPPIEDAVASVDRMEDLVNYAVRLTAERPAANDWAGED